MRRDYTGRPVACLVPGADSRRLHMMAGDPEVTGLVVESSPRDVGKLCAVLLSGLDQTDRRDALRIASALVSGKQKDVIPLPALMPDDADVDQLAALWNGLMLMLLALGSASADTSVGTVVANAASMASGSPFASDPLVGERQNEVVLAKAILEAALLDDETAKAWFKDNELLKALTSITMQSEAGSSDADSKYATATERVANLYDCLSHDLPLGGDALSGSALSEFLSEAYQNAKSGLGQALAKLGDTISGKSSTGHDKDDVKGPGSDMSAASESEHSASHEGNSGSSISEDRGAELDSVLTSSIEDAKSALDEARRSMEEGAENLNQYRSKLQSSALKSARLLWAKELLDAPDDVAQILAATNPNLADPGSFIQSMLATLPAARETGNLGTIKALIYALKSAASKGDGSADSLYSLLTGDVRALAEKYTQDMTSNQSPVLARQRAFVAKMRADSGERGARSVTGSSVEKRKQRGGA